MNTLHNINSDFSVYNGSEAFYKHWLCGIYTEGIKAVADDLNAYWLIDAVFSYNRKEEFQIWTLEVTDGKAVLTMKEDSDRPVKVRQEIPFTDFPEGIFKMYLIDSVLLLPSEY